MRVNADGPGVYVRQFFEQQRLALHNRHRRLRADIAQPKHGGSVADDRNGVALACEFVGFGAVARDFHAHRRHAGRVRGGQVVHSVERHLGVDAELAAIFGVEFKSHFVVVH